MSLVNMTMKVRSVDPQTSIIDVTGELNSFAENILADAMSQATAGGARNVLLNFKGLEYMNSSGIGLLVTTLIRARRQNVRVLACGLSEHYRQIFELTRLNEAITLFPDEAQALDALKVAA